MSRFSLRGSVAKSWLPGIGASFVYERDRLCRGNTNGATRKDESPHRTGRYGLSLFAVRLAGRGLQQTEPALENGTLVLNGSWRRRSSAVHRAWVRGPPVRSGAGGPRSRINARCRSYG